jgi:YceI-like domain
MELGPRNGRLTVHTRKGGAAAKAGHNLLLEVTNWHATYDEVSIELTADASSLRVRSGSGGISPLGDEEKAGIAQTIDDEVLMGGSIVFRSTAVERSGDQVRVRGDLELLGSSAPLTFTLTDSGGHLTGSVTVKQSDWGIKPYSALFGTLKVKDEIEVKIDARTQGD